LILYLFLNIQKLLSLINQSIFQTALYGLLLLIVCDKCFSCFISLGHFPLMLHLKKVLRHLIDRLPYRSCIKLHKQFIDVKFLKSGLDFRILIFSHNPFFLLGFLHIMKHFFIKICLTLHFHFLCVSFIFITVSHFVYFYFSIVIFSLVGVF